VPLHLPMMHRKLRSIAVQRFDLQTEFHQFLRPDNASPQGISKRSQPVPTENVVLTTSPSSTVLPKQLYLRMTEPGLWTGSHSQTGRCGSRHIDAISGSGSGSIPHPQSIQPETRHQRLTTDVISNRALGLSLATEIPLSAYLQQALRGERDSGRASVAKNCQNETFGHSRKDRYATRCVSH